MAAVSGRCPECGTPLRLRVDHRATAEIECPDCRTGLVLVDDPDQPFRKRSLGPAVIAPLKERREPALPAVVKTWGQRLSAKAKDATRRTTDFLHSPFVLACVAAGLVVAVMVAVVVRQEWERHAAEARLAASKSETPVETAVDASESEGVKPPATALKPDSPPDQIASVPLPVVPEVSPQDDLIAAGPPADALSPENAAADIVAIDPVIQRLGQPLLAFKQPAGVPLERQLFFLEELVGVPIEYDESVQPLLAREIELALEETTVADVLTALLKPVELMWRVDKGKILVETGVGDESRTDERAGPPTRKASFSPGSAAIPRN